MMRLNSGLILNFMRLGSLIILVSCAEGSKRARQPMTDSHQVNPAEERGDGRVTPGVEGGNKDNGEGTAVKPVPEPGPKVDEVSKVMTAPKPAVARFRGTVIASHETFFKTSTSQASLLEGNQKCPLKSGETFDVKTNEPGAEQHTKIELMVARPGCTFTAGYVFTPHVKVVPNSEYISQMIK